jgi:hypothetical protein
MLTIIATCAVIITLVIVNNNRDAVFGAVFSTVSATWSTIKWMWYMITLLAIGTLIYGVVYFLLFTLGIVK